MANYDEHSGLVCALFASGTDVSVGPETSKPWAIFLKQLKEVTQADSVALSIEQRNHLIGHWSDGPCVQISPETRQLMRNERIYSQDSLPGGFRPNGFIRAVKQRMGQNGWAVLWVCRGPQSKDFRDTTGQQLGVLTPFLGQAANIWNKLHQERRRAKLTAQLCSDLEAGWILFDRSSFVLDLSPNVHMWGEAVGMRLSPHGRLELSDAQAAKQFLNGFSACLSDTSRRECITLSHSPLAEMTLMNKVIADETFLLGVLRKAPVASAVPVARVANHFGISRNEARLAILLCDGFSIQTAAAQLGWSEETARSYSKSIFSRAAVRGQTGLLRKMLGSSVWFQS